MDRLSGKFEGFDATLPGLAPVLHLDGGSQRLLHQLRRLERAFSVAGSVRGVAILRHVRGSAGDERGVKPPELRLRDEV